MENESDKMNAEVLTQIISTKMPFGKYKGCFLHNIPVNYLEWYGRKGFPVGKLGMLLSTILVIKSNGLEDLLLPLINVKK